MSKSHRKEVAPLRKVTKSSIHRVIAEYLTKLESLRIVPLPSDKPLDLFKLLKRAPVAGGPYEGRSIFEVANRVMSDLVVLAASETLLLSTPCSIADPIGELSILLGNENSGADLSGSLGEGRQLIGECFNVAPTFFARKFYDSRVSLKKKVADIKVIAFNKEAHERINVEKWRGEGFTILTIDVPDHLDRWQSFATSRA